MQQARDEFHESLLRLFNCEELPGEIMAVKQKTVTTNEDGLLRGKGEDIIKAMYDRKTGFSFQDMITFADPETCSFHTRMFKKGQEPGTKQFFLSPNEEYAVYKNSGFATHITPTPWYQFGFGRSLLV